MIVVTSLEKLKRILNKPKKKEKIGFVPTMGALHCGHLSLIRTARRVCDFVVVSIFVNPIQFGPGEDFKRYPENFRKDQALLKGQGVDLVFYPSVKAIYPDDFSTYVEETSLSRVLCGKSRPGHFPGVCTLVTKLFNIIRPDIACFGQKDYQQALIIKKMIKDLNLSIKIKILPIVREKDGLALSSRNAYLNNQQRKDALALSLALRLAKKLINSGERNPEKIKAGMRDLIISQKSNKIDYLTIANAENLKTVKRIKGKILIALAVYLGKTRLIDNLILNVKK